MDPQAVHLPRPQCFCGLTATAIYPDPDAEPAPVADPSSLFYATYEPAADLHPTSRGDTVWAGTRAGSGWPIPPSPTTAARRKRSQAQNGQPFSVLLRSNWVYECHFTPKQEGMVAPDPCLDCQGKPLVDTTKQTTTAVVDDALEAEEPVDEQVILAAENWSDGWDAVRTGTLNDYYNPENVDSTQWPTTLGTPSGWDRAESTREDSSRGKYVDREPKHDPWDHASRSPDAEPRRLSMDPALVSSPPTKQTRPTTSELGPVSKTGLPKEQPPLLSRFLARPKPVRTQEDEAAGGLDDTVEQKIEVQARVEKDDSALKKKTYRHVFDRSTPEPVRPRPVKVVTFCEWNEEHEPAVHFPSSSGDGDEDEGLSLLDWSNEMMAERFLDDDQVDVWEE
ncbi:hypothetical protein BGZ70_001008, partial [Mortierella alpina]